MIVTALVASLGACTTQKSPVDETQTLSPRVIKVGDPVPKGGGEYKLGKAYLANGKWYQPVNDVNYDQVGLASWYGDFFHGRKTANGEIYDMGALTAAHPTLPMPTYAQVTNLDNNRTVIVRINDRGPYHDGRIIDLSRKAAELLGFHGRGTAAVRVRYFAPAPLNGDDHLERSILAKQPWAARSVSSVQTPARPQMATAPASAGVQIAAATAVPVRKAAPTTAPARARQVSAPIAATASMGAWAPVVATNAPTRQATAAKAATPAKAAPVKAAATQPAPAQPATYIASATAFSASTETFDKPLVVKKGGFEASIHDAGAGWSSNSRPAFSTGAAFNGGQ
ncbi:septal ring lytic transglycosylase RlpA family protein [Rhodomicrobium vannielii ATCC 17100]|uniref:septal ring lytic transglycosylase RlpA family protein n=1 Tax=Rhodomicrobium vannielii TaxID=1069 RepID=UPI00191A13DF|nr:septal ring lytic transglycosylase RlpA family protein [Rhodomicrobium vannielii]MBJ7536000.1 septal ring lytic transglycosylase RlpA family protein [Rhodomicrobium vannielii ATCC 17100]